MVAQFVNVMEQLLPEQLLPATSACGLSGSQLAAVLCQEREDCVEERERLVVARKPASTFVRKQCLIYSNLCGHLVGGDLCCVCKDRVPQELEHALHPHSFSSYFPVFPAASHIASILHSLLEQLLGFHHRQ